MNDGDAVGPFEYRFVPRSLAAIRVARNVLAGWLHCQPHAAPGAIDDLLIAVSELCTNSVQHSRGRHRRVILRGRADGDTVVVEVEDDGQGFDPRSYESNVPMIDLRAEMGRGLAIVRSVVDRVEFERSEGRMLVRCFKDGALSGAGARPRSRAGAREA